MIFSPLSWGKYQVCSITINSADEIEVFKEFLPQESFEFVELLPSLVNEEQDHSSHWFNQACKHDYRCDILVISGHFGGTFFGESGYALPTELLEEKACKSSCSGILSQVKEIFLFGCNTLADKKKDHRTHTEYLQVLLDDGLARETAERVVAARYSPLETPFYARMNFIFSGSDMIYGFDQLSPLGKYVRSPLRKYFQSINQSFGSYAEYLRTNQHKRSHNKELFKHFPRPKYTLNQAVISLSSENQTQKKFFNDKCLLYDDTQNFNRRVQALSDIFHSGQSGSAFFSIDHFLNNNKRRIKEGGGQNLFRAIRSNPSFADKFLSYYKHLDFLPYIKMVYLNILENFQWMDPAELHVRRKQALLELIKKPDPEAYISLLLLLKDKQIEAGRFYISKTDLPEDYIQNIWSLLIFEKLKAIAPHWQSDMLEYCEDNIETAPALCYQVLNTLAHIQPDWEAVQKSVKFLNEEDEGLIHYSIRMLGQTEVQDYHVHKKISSFLTHSNQDIQHEALEALGFLRSPYPDIQDDIAKLLPQARPELAEEIFWSFNRMNLKSHFVQKTIMQYIQKPSSEESFKKAWFALENTVDFSDLTLSFLYKELESREDPKFLLSLIENLVQNRQLKDLGIHYRFLLFQNEESTQLKRQVLEKMASMKWMHPETQIEFLNYVKDTDAKVRANAVNVLENISNLKPRTLQEIKKLYNKEKIKELKVFL